MGVHGSPWESMGLPWTPMNCHGSPWESMDSHGCARRAQPQDSGPPVPRRGVRGAVLERAGGGAAA
eukprot:3533073-Lingulodinium_polyedra.AAC.1